MAAIAGSDVRTGPDHFASRVPAFGWLLIAAGLFLVSAVLQLVASLERWVTFAGASTDGSIEDHLFDYYYPADPWENLGITAQVYGVGLLLFALGIVALARGAAPNGSHATRLLVRVTAVSFALTGAHALVSGVIGMPTVLQYLPVQLLLSAVGVVGLIVLGVRVARKSWPASVACVLLLGSTLPGLIFASIMIAPEIVGYQSHDMTPFTETIVASPTAAAAFMLLVAAALSHRARRVPRTADATRAV